MKTISAVRYAAVSAAGGETVKTSGGTTLVTLNAGDVVMVASVSEVAAMMGSQQNTVTYSPASNPSWPRSIRANNLAVMVIKMGVTGVAWATSVLAQVSNLLEQTLTWTPPTIVTQPANDSVANGGGRYAEFTVVAGSELAPLTYAWKESADGVTYGSALTTGTVGATSYDVSVAGTLKITPTDTTKNGYYYKCAVTDSAASPGTVTSKAVVLTVT